MTEAGAGTDCGTHENVGREGGRRLGEGQGRAGVSMSVREAGRSRARRPPVDIVVTRASTQRVLCIYPETEKLNCTYSSG